MVIGHGYAKLNRPAHEGAVRSARLCGRPATSKQAPRRAAWSEKCGTSSTAETAGSIDRRDTRVQSPRRDLRAWRNASGRILRAGILKAGTPGAEEGTTCSIFATCFNANA